MPQVMPAEWEPHARCLMAWIGDDMVSTRLTTAVKVDYGLVARAIVRFEPLLVVASPEYGKEAAAYCRGAEVIEHELQGFYLRDSGPSLVRKDDGTLAAVDFLFNGWGGGTPNATVGEAIAKHLKIERQPVPLVLEGGSFTVNGQGALIAVEPTVLHENRNPGATRTVFEAAFKEFLGVDMTVWLPNGLVEDRTGGHVDNVAAFIGLNTVAVQTTTRGDPNHNRLERNREMLEQAGFETVALPTVYRQWAGRRIALPYVNFYLGNGCAIVPLALQPSDDEAIATLEKALPDREVVGVPATNLWRRGGGPHCITQQQPQDQ
ncbi:MAG: agmatine deiminase family protein [Thermoleophilaceae bacterium]